MVIWQRALKITVSCRQSYYWSNFFPRSDHSDALTTMCPTTPPFGNVFSSYLPVKQSHAPSCPAGCSNHPPLLCLLQPPNIPQIYRFIFIRSLNIVGDFTSLSDKTIYKFNISEWRVPLSLNNGITAVMFVLQLKLLSQQDVLTSVLCAMKACCATPCPQGFYLSWRKNSSQTEWKGRLGDPI